MKNKVLFITTIILSVFGLIMIYSSSYVWASYKFNNAFKYVINQGIFLILGIILMTILSKIDSCFYKKYSNLSIDHIKTPSIKDNLTKISIAL